MNDRHDEMFPSDHEYVENLGGSQEGREWIEQLPALVGDYCSQWELAPKTPYRGGSASWVAPVVCADGTAAVLKVAWPHAEGSGELPALRAWAGDGAIKVLQADQNDSVYLLEMSTPGETLRDACHLSATRRIEIGADLLRRLWSAPVPPPDAPPESHLPRITTVGPASADIAQERFDRCRPQFDRSLVESGLDLLRTLPFDAKYEAVLHGDFNPGNILSSTREAWLVVDPKGVVGDPAFDPWPLLSQVDDPFQYDDPCEVLAERLAIIADITDISVERMVKWALARDVEFALLAISEGDRETGANVMCKTRRLAELLA